MRNNLHCFYWDFVVRVGGVSTRVEYGLIHNRNYSRRHVSAYYSGIAHYFGIAHHPGRTVLKKMGLRSLCL